jgi:uncharacterized protein (DUF1501 family)
MWTRREFLNRTAAACGGCLGLGNAAPTLWSNVAAAAEASTSGRKLVVIELQGGNDGLNTVIPFADDAYYRARPTLGVPVGDVVKLDDHLGLHPAMKPWRALWDAGRLSIVENCGYPQPNRSHFESMDIWHAGQVGSPAPSGWLGRASDQVDAGDLCFVGEGNVPSALSRRLRSVVSLSRLNDLQLRSDLASAAQQIDAADDLEGIISGRLAEVRDFSKRPHGRTLPAALARLMANDRPLVEHLSVVRTLIEQDQPFHVYYTALDGFDTHAQQRGNHESLWRQASEAVSGFLDRLREKDRADNVAVFLFSEFGRRVKENGSQGTDHGAAAPVFLLGDHVRSGIQGGVPNLADLDDGDVRHTIDFRDVYASVLRDWLGVDPTPVLGVRNTELKLFT